MFFYLKSLNPARLLERHYVHTTVEVGIGNVF